MSKVSNLPTEIGVATSAQTPRIQSVARNAEGNVFRLPATHADPFQERLHRKQQLAATLRILARYGVEPGLSGHVTARDPLDLDGFWINPVGVDFAQIRVSDLIRVDGAGKIVDGAGDVNRSGVPHHLELQREFPRIVGIVHAHSFYAQAWSVFGEPVERVIDDISLLHAEQVVFDPQAQAGESKAALGSRFVSTFRDHNILIWKNHGHWTLGETVEAAAWRFVAFELATKLQLTVLSTGKAYTSARPADYGVETRETFAALGFFPYWDRVVRDEPDFLA